MSKKRKKPGHRKKRTQRVADRSKPEAFKVVYFFIPLRIPLRIPDGQIIRFTSPADPFEENEESIGTVWDEEHGDEIDLISSIVIHQVQDRKIDTYIKAACKAANSAFLSDHIPNADKSGQGSSPGVPEITITVIEAAVRLIGIPDGLEDPANRTADNAKAIEQSMTRAFDHVIDNIRALQRSYILVTSI